MRSAFSRSVFTATVALWSLVVFSTVSSAQTTYTVTDIGRLPGCFAVIVNGINDAGSVAGTCQVSAGGVSTPYPFLFDGVLHQLGTEPGLAWAINDHGEVAGELRNPNSHAFRWDGVMHDLGTLAFGTRSRGLAINNSGIVVGAAQQLNDEVAFRFIGNMQPFGSLPGDTDSSANGISDAGTIVGSSFGITGGPALTRAFAFVEPTFQYLGTLPGLSHSAATAINNVGQIAGISFQTQCPIGVPCTYRAWVYDGTLHELGVPGEQVVANAINDAGEVVGASFSLATNYHAFRYANGQGWT